MSTFSSPGDAQPLTSVAVRWVLARLLATQFAFGLGVSAFLLLPKHLAEQGAEGWILGAIVSAMSVSVVIATPLAAYLADRVHPARLARSGALVLAISSFAFHLTPEAGPLMLVLRGFHGLAFSLTLTGTAAFAANIAAPNRLARTLGLFGATMLATQAVAPALLEPLTERFGWGALYTAATFTALVAVGLTLSMPVPRSHEKLTPVVPVAAAAHSPASKLLRSCLEASAVMGFAFGAVVAFAPALALERGASSISALFMGYTALALGIRLLGGGLGDAFGHARISLGALVVYALVILGFTQLQPNLLAVLGGGLGLSHGLMFPSLNALVLHETAPERRGRVQALFFGSFHFGMAVSGVLLGALVPYVGYAGLFVVAGASVLLVGVHLGWATRHQLGAPPQEPTPASTPRVVR
jgi:MFS family permease